MVCADQLSPAQPRPLLTYVSAVETTVPFYNANLQQGQSAYLKEALKEN